MALSLFEPFKDMLFDDHFCFLSGDLTTEKMTVFPKWLMAHFKLEDEEITLMESSKAKNIRYADLQVPCAPHVKDAFEELDQTFHKAYQEGYEAIAALDEYILFIWSGRIVYGLMYLELVGELKLHEKKGETFKVSSKLKTHMYEFHLMLQSLITPVTFSDKKPWSLVVFPLKYSADILSFRDDVTNMLFQFGVNGFGFIISFKDNGVIAEKQKELLEKIKGKMLHPVQFEELYARLHYTADLMQYRPTYSYETSENELKIVAHPVEQTQPDLPVFGLWNDDFYARLLSNYWQVYGIEKGEIIQFHRPFLSFLEDPYTKEFIDAKVIKLPY